MSTTFQKVISAVALSAVAAAWFVGAKGGFTDHAVADENSHNVTVSQVSTQFGEGAKNITRQESRTVHLSEWGCYDGAEVKEQATFLYNVLSRSNIGLFTLHTLENTDIRICTASQDTYAKTWGKESGATFDPSTNIAFFSKKNPGPLVTTHEIAHGNKALATKMLSNRLLEEGKYTGFVVSTLADEAGSIALQVVSAYNDHLKGSSGQYHRLMSLGPNSPQGAMAQILDRLIQEKPAWGAIGAIPSLQFPAEAMDQLLSRYLNHAGQEPYIHNAFSDAKDAYDGVDSPPPSSNFDAPRISPSEAGLMTLGTMYKSGTEFPLAAKALEELGRNLSPFMAKELPFIKRDEELEAMTTSFVKTLPRMNQIASISPNAQTNSVLLYTSLIHP